MVCAPSSPYLFNRSEKKEGEVDFAQCTSHRMPPQQGHGRLQRAASARKTRSSWACSFSQAESEWLSCG